MVLLACRGRACGEGLLVEAVDLLLAVSAERELDLGGGGGVDDRFAGECGEELACGGIAVIVSLMTTLTAFSSLNPSSMEYPRDSKNVRDRARSLTARLTKIVVGIDMTLL